MVYALALTHRDVDVSRAEVDDGVLHFRLHRRITGEGTATIARALGRGRRQLSMDGVALAELDGTTVVRCPEGEPKSFALAPLS